MPRSEAEVRDALAELATVGRRAAMLPKNAEKGHWKNLGIRDLLALFLEEAGEVARAYNHGESLESFVAEIGDAAWVLAALLDNATGIKKTVKLVQATRVQPIEEMFPVSEAQFKKTEQERLQKKPPMPSVRDAILSNSVKEPTDPPMSWPLTESGCALVVNTAAVSRLEIYGDEPPMPGCHLELKLLDAAQPCGACGIVAKQHRNWKGSKG